MTRIVSGEEREPTRSYIFKNFGGMTRVVSGEEKEPTRSYIFKNFEVFW